MYANVIWNLKICVSETKYMYIWSTNKIWKEIAVLECKNENIFKARSLHSLAYS